MSKEQNLIVNMTMNPPFITIIGAVQEGTIQKLNSILPTVCSTVVSDKTRFAFERKEHPPHWVGTLPTSFANEEVGQSTLVLALLDALEAEGGWKLKGSNAMNHDFDKVTYKYFFVKTM
eukprot:GILI01007874.1.p1 GENE.GILI01007874.1~~GILI01007874.1.p1  ORF type:complete len:119 (-),score=48.39 GILI01007874.1:218-574(-)